MRNFHLFPVWGVMAFLVCGMAMTSLSANGESKDGINFTIYEGSSFTNIVNTLAKEAGLNVKMLETIDARLGKLNFSTPTPPVKIIEQLAIAQGLDFWQNGDTYYIGRRNAVPVTPMIDPLPSSPISTAPVNTYTYANRTFPEYTPESTQYAPPAKPVYYIRKIELQHTSPTDMAWMFGINSGKPPSAQRKPVLRQRIRSAFESRTPSVELDAYGNSISPALSSPWNKYMGTGSVSRRDSATNALQSVGGGFNPGGGFRPGSVNPPAGGTTGGATAPGGTTTPAAPAERTGLGGDLASFLPDGIEDIVALVGLNALLVRASNEEALDKLELLIKMLDKPVKQVIVEAMIVKMEVIDAQSFGVSWEWAGMPVSITSNNPSGGGNFSMRYVKGNVRAALDSMIATSKAKVVNAPRVIVQNGSSADIMMSESVPFITVTQSEDVFGRQTETPEVQIQTFEKGLNVSEVTIHPDGYITLQIEPILQFPGTGIGIPGGSGEVSGGSEATVNTVLRVKNGETIMMGGFVSKNESEGGTRTPLLSNLPVLGPLLFSNSNKSWNNTETLIFVTPTIMEEDSTSFQGMSSLPPIW